MGSTASALEMSEVGGLLPSRSSVQSSRYTGQLKEEPSDVQTKNAVLAKVQISFGLQWEYIGEDSCNILHRCVSEDCK